MWKKKHFPRLNEIFDTCCIDIIYSIKIFKVCRRTNYATNFILVWEYKKVYVFWWWCVNFFKYIDYFFCYCCEKIPIVSVEGLFSQSFTSLAKKLDDLVSFFSTISKMKNYFSLCFILCVCLKILLWLKAWNCCLACTLELEVSQKRFLLLCSYEFEIWSAVRSNPNY